MIHERVDQFIKFCETQEPYREYNWESSNMCALGEFCNYSNTGWDMYEFTMCNAISNLDPRTYGALADRLRRHYYR